jgi:thiamine-phosphate pyrophosphorylase
MKKTLPEIVNELNQQSGYENMPSLIFITDQKAQPYPEQIIDKLPKGAMVILRDYDHKNREELAEALAYICKQKGIKFFVAGDLLLTLKLKADGIHLPQFMIGELAMIKREHPDIIVSVSCHDIKAVNLAEQNGADLILAAPVFATKSHMNTFKDTNLTLGIEGLKQICAGCKIPVYALGGINAETATDLKHTGVTGIAAIRGFS